MTALPPPLFHHRQRHNLIVSCLIDNYRLYILIKVIYSSLSDANKLCEQNSSEYHLHNLSLLYLQGRNICTYFNLHEIIHHFVFGNNLRWQKSCFEVACKIVTDLNPFHQSSSKIMLNFWKGSKLWLNKDDLRHTRECEIKIREVDRR